MLAGAAQRAGLFRLQLRPFIGQLNDGALQFTQATHVQQRLMLALVLLAQLLQRQRFLLSMLL